MYTALPRDSSHQSHTMQIKNNGQKMTSRKHTRGPTSSTIADATALFRLAGCFILNFYQFISSYSRTISLIRYYVHELFLPFPELFNLLYNYTNTMIDLHDKTKGINKITQNLSESTTTKNINISPHVGFRSCKHGLLGISRHYSTQS